MRSKKAAMLRLGGWQAEVGEELSITITVRFLLILKLLKQL